MTLIGIVVLRPQLSDTEVGFLADTNENQSFNLVIIIFIIDRVLWPLHFFWLTGNESPSAASIECGKEPCWPRSSLRQVLQSPSKKNSSQNL